MSRTVAVIAGLVAVVAIVTIAVLVAGGSDDPAAAPQTTVPVTTTEPGTTAPPATPPPTTTTTPASRPPVFPRPVATEPPPGFDDLTDDLVAVAAPWPTDWSQRTIDLSELKIGLPTFDPRDLIRPIDQPTYDSIAQADSWLVDREIGVLVDLGSIVRYYPLRILTSHEVLNDTVGNLPFVVTYCPLCNTAVAYDRRVDGETLRFGVSGLLRNSDLVMWDDQTTSLWQQITGEGIVGVHAGRQLTALPSALVTWGDFKASHPDGEALSQNTGFGFNYGTNGYVGYSSRSAPFSSFFDAPLDERLPALERVVGVRVGDAAKAYPFSVIGEPRAVNDELGGEPIAVWWADTDAADNFAGEQPGTGRGIGTGIAFLRTLDGQVLTFSPADGTTFADQETGSTWSALGEAVAGPLAGSRLQLAPHQNEFWFAWRAFNPEAPVYGL